MKNRRRSRELALKALYAHEAGAGDCLTVLEGIADSESIQPPVRDYARFLADKTVSLRDEADVIITRHAQNWDLRRMAAVDRNVMRLAVTELRFSGDVPIKVVIDEAVELAKLYGADESGKFVNGIIDSIHKELTANCGEAERTL